MSPESQFEAAADAVVNGDIATLRHLLKENPGLIRARSHREHAATLLHYVAANGVEDHRQKTPPNITEIAELLLKAGAEIDAIANVYGGSTTLGLTATSIHPERAGLQEALLQTLLDHGATIHPSIVDACLANGRYRAAVFLASRGAPLDFSEAAGLGDLDRVQAVFAQARPPESDVDRGFLFACAYGQNPVIECVLAKGAHLSAHDSHGQTALHHAVIGAHLDAVNLLLRRHAPLEVENSYGGTPLGQALWSAAHADDPASYLPILDALAQAGANIPAHCASIHPLIDRWLAQHGCGVEHA